MKGMDFGGMVSVDGSVGASSQGGSQFSSSLTPSNFGVSRQRQLLGSSFQKHDRPAEAEEYDLRSLKLARTEEMAKATPFLLGSNSHHVYGEGEQMLSFSSPHKQDSLMLSSDGTLPYYNHPSASSTAHACLRNAGCYSGSSNVSMHGVLARVRGPFTPSQWLELEHQALIYKYIVANVPVPASLLVPIRRSLTHSGFTPFSAGTFGSNSLGWGSFHLGYSGNADPEPGRCRRTDGKKWRCSRDAVADQKYCERHMNRGRHRSRKHVESQNGHAAKAMPAITSSQPALSASGSGSSASFSIAPQQAKALQPNDTAPSHPQFNRILMGKTSLNDHTQDSGSLSIIASMNPKPSNTLFSISKQHNPFEPTHPQADFGLISSGSLLNPPSSSSDNIDFVSSCKLNNQQSQLNPFRQFMDDWPKTHSDRSTITWHGVEDMQSDGTQLSISIPVASSDFSSSSSSPNHEKLLLSPLKLSREYDPIHMGLGVGTLSEASQRQANWIPISWEASMAGPLGEVLTNTNNTPKDQSRNSSLNILNEGWDSSPRLDSSPTGVLQKTSFDSLSSNTSSPRVGNHKANENTGSLCDDILGKTLVNPPAIPSL